MSLSDKIPAEQLLHAFRNFAGNTAIHDRDGSHSYSALESFSTGIANSLEKCLPASDKPVAILGEKLFYTYAGICGSLFASRPYMPLNTKFPLARNLQMMRLSGARALVAEKSSAGMLKELLQHMKEPMKVILEEDADGWQQEFPHHEFLHAEAAGELNHPIRANVAGLAYLLFTSGTTGTPKGVPVSNRNLMAYTGYMLGKYDFNENDRFSHTFDLTFDLSVHDMMLSWLSGAALCIPDDDSPLRMAKYIREKQISIWFSVPSAGLLMKRMRLLKPDSIPGLRMSFFCGEPLPASIAEQWQKASGGMPLINLYGPSEATIAISEYAWKEGHRKEKNGIVSIGKLFAGQKYCLAEAGEPRESKTGRGELCLGGSQVIEAYLDAPEISKHSFVELENLPGRWYRTGDLVEVDEEGDLFYLGRLDAEVKISGFRVNLLEVDHVLRKAAGTEQAASVLDNTATPRIVAFIVDDNGKSEQEIMAECRKSLPWYMMPEVIIFVTEMPLNVNGKIDRNELKKIIHG